MDTTVTTYTLDEVLELLKQRMVARLAQQQEEQHREALATALRAAAAEYGASDAALNERLALLRDTRAELRQRLGPMRETASQLPEPQRSAAERVLAEMEAALDTTFEAQLLGPQALVEAVLERYGL